MKALSLWQPWAMLIALGEKRIETRGWSTSYRGPIAIHAAKKWNNALWLTCALPFFEEILGHHGREPDDLPRGCFVAVAHLVDVVRAEEARGYITKQEMAFGDYSDGRYAWMLKDAESIEPTIEGRGQQGLWQLPGPFAELLQSRLAQDQPPEPPPPAGFLFYIDAIP